MVTEKKIIKSNGVTELRSVVKLYVALNKSPAEIVRMIKPTGNMINAVQLLFINGTHVLGAEANQLRTISGAANRQSKFVPLNIWLRTWLTWTEEPPSEL